MPERIRAVTTAVVEANFDYTFVRLHTTEGRHGTGECFPAPALVEIITALGELLIGADPRQVGPLVHRMRKAISGAGSWSGAGIAYNAVSGIETALWDLAGKIDGQPIAELLGGRFRDSVPVYIDCHGGHGLQSLDALLRYRTPSWQVTAARPEVGDSFWEAGEPDAVGADAWLRRAGHAIDRGFRKLKFDLDSFVDSRAIEDRTADATSIEAMVQAMAGLREGLGPGTDVALDCHWRFDVPTALSIARALEPFAPMWLEDPVPPNTQALARIQGATSVPIATGENVYLVEGFRPLIDQSAVAVVTPDAQKCGGLAETKRILDDAALAFIQGAPHCVAGPLGLAATAHACAASTNVLCLEFHGGDVPFWRELVDDDVIVDGEAVVSTRPGIGVELDEELVRRYSPRDAPVFDKDVTVSR